MSNTNPPSPSSKTKTSTSTTKPSAYQATLADGVTARVVWSRGNNNPDSPTVAEFSLDIYTDKGTRIAAANKLQLRSSIDRNSGQPITRIGSMTYDGEIFAHTFFPGSNQDPKQAERLQRFTEEIVEAVQAHIEDNIRTMKDYKDRRNMPNPQLAGLRQTIDQAVTLRQRR
jgi:hypothetical protein